MMHKLILKKKHVPCELSHLPLYELSKHASTAKLKGTIDKKNHPFYNVVTIFPWGQNFFSPQTIFFFYYEISVYQYYFFKQKHISLLLKTIWSDYLFILLLLLSNQDMYFYNIWSMKICFKNNLLGRLLATKANKIHNSSLSIYLHNLNLMYI